MDTKTEFNLNNLIATLSLISISSVKKFAGKCPQTWSQLRSMNAKAGEDRHSELCGLDVTISARYDWSVARQLTSFPLRHWNLGNLTLQQECYLTNTRAFFRTYQGRGRRLLKFSYMHHPTKNDVTSGLN